MHSSGGLIKFVYIRKRGGRFLGQSLIKVEPKEMKWLMNFVKKERAPKLMMNFVITD